MAEITANESIEQYDEWASSALGNANSEGLAAHDSPDGQLAFRLEIVLVPGREGEKLQAIQARAIREALLWAANREDNGNSPGEGGNDGHDD